MFRVLLRAVSFTFIIVIGIIMKSTGVATKSAGDFIKKVLLYVTLPCTIITNFSAIEDMGMDMVIVALLGSLANIVMIALGLFLTKRRSKEDQALYMLCLPAYNIGAFSLPFVQSFLPALGSVATCMYDVGNSILCTGGTYAFVSEYISDNKKNGIDLKSFGKRLVTSPPLVTYVVMFVLSILHFKMPQIILTFVEPMYKANTFVAMLMLGLLFHVEFKREYMMEIAKIVGIRHIFAIICGLLFYFVLPFDPIIKQTLTIISFAPMSVVAPAYTGMCGGDEGMASCANSVTILCSLVEITTLLALMGLS